MNQIFSCRYECILWNEIFRILILKFQKLLKDEKKNLRLHNVFFQGLVKKNYNPAKLVHCHNLKKLFQNITKIIDTILAYLKSQKTQFGTLVF
jgi:hypothetical protein